MVDHHAASMPMPVRQQIEFARHNYDNQQAIIRQLDTKAGVFITILVVLLSAATPSIRDVAAKVVWHGRGAISSWLFAGSGIILVSGLLMTAICVQRVIRPRASEYQSLSSGLMFGEDVLAHADPERYHEATRMADEGTLLQNLTMQIFQLSAIARRKRDALNVALWPTVLSFLAWAVHALFGAYILTWR
jgi:hypothetical protein